MPVAPSTTESTLDIRREGSRVMNDWLTSLGTAAERGQPVAYTMVMGSCAEILRAFGFAQALPEVTALQAAVRKVAPRFIALAEDYGYSPDICNYVKSDVGLLLSGMEHPAIGRLSPPDLVITSNLCTVYTKWAEIYEKMTNAVSFVLDIPQRRRADRATGVGCPGWDADLAWVEAQLWDLITRCEAITGTRFDPERLAQVEADVNEMIGLWKDILALNRHRPAPYDLLVDGTVFMGVMNALRGSPEGVTYFRQVRDELTRRVEAGEGCGTEERFRLAFSGVPQWARLREMIHLFKDLGGVFVVGDYPTFACAGLDLTDIPYDPARPVESLAEVTLLASQRGCSTLIYPQLLLADMMRGYEVDGLVFHAIKSCRTVSTSMADVREHLGRDVAGVPSVYLESDHMDDRYWSPAQLKNRVDAFFEVLAQRALTREGM